MPNTVASASRPRPSQSPRGTPAIGWPKLAVLIGAAAVALFFAGLVGYVVGKPSGQLVSVTNTFQGKVSKLTFDQTSGCIRDASGHRYCGGVSVINNVHLHAGEPIRAAVLQVQLRDGVSVEHLLVYPLATSG